MGRLGCTLFGVWTLRVPSIRFVCLRCVPCLVVLSRFGFVEHCHFMQSFVFPLLAALLAPAARYGSSLSGSGHALVNARASSNPLREVTSNAPTNVRVHHNFLLGSAKFQSSPSIVLDGLGLDVAATLASWHAAWPPWHDTETTPSSSSAHLRTGQRPPK